MEEKMAEQIVKRPSQIFLMKKGIGYGKRFMALNSDHKNTYDRLLTIEAKLDELNLIRLTVATFTEPHAFKYVESVTFDLGQRIHELKLEQNTFIKQYDL
jgi:hypothetical protein